MSPVFWARSIEVNHSFLIMDASRIFTGGIHFCFDLNSSVVVVINEVGNCFGENCKRRIFLLIPIKHFGFQSAEECFHDAVLIAVAHKKESTKKALACHLTEGVNLGRFILQCAVFYFPTQKRLNTWSSSFSSMQSPVISDSASCACCKSTLAKSTENSSSVCSA